MRVSFNFNKRTVADFEGTCEATIRNVGRGTKRATEEACKAILAESLAQVPRDTATLAKSAGYKVWRRTDTSINTWAYEGLVGYAITHDPINPKTGHPASSYAMEVHEDLYVRHKVGKAKFLEDPVRAYATDNFRRNVFNYWNASIKQSGGG